MTGDELAELRRQFAVAVLLDRGRLRRCWLATFDPRGRPCYGRMEACHFLKRQAVERDVAYNVRDRLEADVVEDLAHLAAWDPRNGIPGCEVHHGRFDSHLMPPLEVDREHVPEDVEAFARDWGLEHVLDHYHPPIGGGI